MFSSKERVKIANFEQTLIGLGLTSCQAKIYLTIANTNGLAAKEIAKTANTARPHCYQALAQLQHKGLVIRMIGKPNKYQAVEPAQILERLLQKEQTRLNELQHEVEEFIHDFEIEKETKSIDNYNEQFVLFPKGEAVIRRNIAEIRAAQKSIQFVSSDSSINEALRLYRHPLKEALERGVRVEWLFVHPRSKAIEQSRHVVSLKKNPNFRIKPLFNSQKARVGIYDSRIVRVAIDPDEGIADSPVLWISNPSIVDIIEEYFDFLWQLPSTSEDSIDML